MRFLLYSFLIFPFICFAEFSSDFDKIGAYYFKSFPDKEFCEIWIRICDINIKEHINPYYKGYWQGQKDICVFILNKN